MFTTCTSPRRVEDRLGAVAVVIVDVEHADPRRALRRSHSAATAALLTKQYPPAKRAPGVVPGRTAEREGRPRAAAHQRRGGQRHVVARLDRLPGARDEGGAGVHGVEPEQPVDVGGRDVGAQPRHRPDEGHRGAVRGPPPPRAARRAAGTPDSPAHAPAAPPEVVRARAPGPGRARPPRPAPARSRPGAASRRPARSRRASARRCRHGRHGAANRPSASAAPAG